MDFSTLYQSNSNTFKWANLLFYVAFGFLVLTIFCYGIFTIKVFLEEETIRQLNEKILMHTTPQDALMESKILDYKKKIDDFTVLVNDHRISSHMFNFIEQKTLPKVWFSNVSVSQAKSEINLAGEAANMETLDNQVHVFEESRDYVNTITVLNSEVTSQGRIKFIVSLSLNPKIFAYGADMMVPSNTQP